MRATSGRRACLRTAVVVAAIGVLACTGASGQQWPACGRACCWSEQSDPANQLQARFVPPQGFVREDAAPDGFAAWLRELPLRPGRPPVHLYDGRLKLNQQAHAAVVDIDVGRRDLQQCADAVIRLRAEYLYAAGRSSEIAFRFTSGDRASFARWAEGWRPEVAGSAVRWVRKAGPDGTYASLRRFLDVIMTYAGSWSLERELEPVAPVGSMQPGDVLIQGGFPGHAVLVADMAVEKASGRRVFLLIQSYMPAQEIHLLANPSDAALSPWYALDGLGPRLVTPEWVFAPQHLRRFSR